MTSGASPFSAALAAPVGGSTAVGYADAAASRARGAAQSGPQVNEALRGGQAQPSARRGSVAVQLAPQRLVGLSTPLADHPAALAAAARHGRHVAVAPLRGARLRIPACGRGKQIKPRSRVSQWPVTDKGAALKELLVLGATADEARDVAGAALQRWEAVRAVSTVFLVQSAAKAHCCVERLLRALDLSRADLEVQRGALQCQPLTLKAPWECATEGEVDRALPGHTLVAQIKVNMLIFHF